MGAGTRATLPGRTSKASESPTSAFVAISPQGMYSAADKHRWDDVKRPTMTIYGSHDTGAQGQPASWRRDPFDHMPADDKYNLVIEGANHFSFADQPVSALLQQLVQSGQTRDVSQIHDAVLAATLAFWNAYLKNNSQAKAALRNHQRLSGLDGYATLSSK